MVLSILVISRTFWRFKLNSCFNFSRYCYWCIISSFLKSFNTWEKNALSLSLRNIEKKINTQTDVPKKLVFFSIHLVFTFATF